MSWDVSIQRFSRDFESIEDIPETEVCLAIGSQAEVRTAVSQYFPGTNWSDPTWGIFNATVGSIEFNMGKDEPSTGFAMHIRATPEILRPIVEMCRALAWQALDFSSGAFIERAVNPDEASLIEWIAYRNRIVGGSNA